MSFSAWGSLVLDFFKRARLKWLILTLLTGVGLLILWTWNGGTVELFDWDEINFAEMAREMFVTGDFFSVRVGFEPFWEKPPLYAWMQALSFSLFGINEWAARLPNAMAGVVTPLLCWVFGRRWLGRSSAWLWPAFLVGSVLPHFYFKVGLIDPWFNVFIYGAIYLWSRERWKTSGAVLGLAVLTKGPVALLLFLPAGMAASTGMLFRRGAMGRAFQFLACLTATGFTWYAWGAFKNPALVADFFRYQWRLFSTADAGHRGPLFFHLWVLLLGCVPASIYVLSSSFKDWSDRWREDEALRINVVLFLWVVLIFSVVQTKIVHYSSLAYLPLAYLAARGASNPRFQVQPVWNGILFSCWGIGVLLLGWAIQRPLEMVAKLASWLPNLQNATLNGNAAAALSDPTLFPHAMGWCSAVSLLCLAAALPFRFRGARWVQWTASIALAQLLFGLALPAVEHWTQGPLVKFAKEMPQGCTLTSLEFKSFVPFYYANREPVPSRPDCQYLVAKVSREAEVRQRSDVEWVGRFGHFAFFKLRNRIK